MPVFLDFLAETFEFSGEFDLVYLALSIVVPVILVDDRDIGLWHHPADRSGSGAAQKLASESIRAGDRALVQAPVLGGHVATC